MTSSSVRERMLSVYATSIATFLMGANAVRNLFDWPVFITLALLLLLLGVGLLPFLGRIRPPRSPAMILLFMFLVWISLTAFWSEYTLEVGLGVAAQLATTLVAMLLGMTMEQKDLLRSFANALRIVLVGSLAFELWVAFFWKGPLLPLWANQHDAPESKLLLWSRDLLFSGGPIQGLPGSSVLLGFWAVVGLVLFTVEVSSRTSRSIAGYLSILLAVAVIFLARGATSTVAVVAVSLVAGIALLAQKVEEKRTLVYFVTLPLLVVFGFLAIIFRSALFSVLGKSESLTGRTEIWGKVWELISQRPLTGWGWVSYWPPWVEPFRGLDMKVNLPVMSAHNAWLDVWFQAGLVGLGLFIAFVGATFWFSWQHAMHSSSANRSRREKLISLWPLLILVALLVQSITESRLLSEIGWFLLVVIAVTVSAPGRSEGLGTVPGRTDARRKAEGN